MQNKNLNKRGKFIVLEGIDGCGKDTQQKILKEKFPDFECFHVLDESKKHTNTLRDAMFKSDYKWDTMSEMLMFWADKFETILQIKKAIEQGKNVIMNRWELSNLAYQIYGKNTPMPGGKVEKVDEEFARFMQAKLDAILKPDLYILYDISVEESEKRRIARSNKAGGNQTDNYYEQSKKDFFERVITGYKTEIQKYKGTPTRICNYAIINGEQSKEKVFEDTLNEIRKII